MRLLDEKTNTIRVNKIRFAVINPIINHLSVQSIVKYDFANPVDTYVVVSGLVKLISVCVQVVIGVPMIILWFPKFWFMYEVDLQFPSQSV